MNSSVDWPALGWEEQTWIPSATWGTKAGQRTQTRNYLSAIPPQIRNLNPVVSAEAAAIAQEATQELTRFDAKQGTQISPFAPVLLRSEASSSSQIENLTASARSILSAELGQKTGQNAQLIAANTKALRASLSLSEDFSVPSILSMHETLMENYPNQTPGKFRQEAVWIGTRSDTPIGATFVAPHYSRVLELTEDLVTFARRLDIAPMISVAISYAQFETIHPFTDGNGRTGRALAQSLLRYRAVTQNIAVPVSAGLLADLEGYHHALDAYRQGDINPIVIAFSSASLRAISNSQQLIVELQEIRQSWTERLHFRKDSNAWKLLDILIQFPILDSATAAKLVNVQQPNIHPPLQALVDAGILQSKNEHRLGSFWRSDEVLDAIDRFAERAGRREIF